MTAPSSLPAPACLELPASDSTSASAPVSETGATHASALPDEVQSAFDYTPAALAGHLAGTGVVALLYAQSAPRATLGSWLAAFAVLLAVRVAMLRRFRREPPRGLADWARWRVRWNVGALSSAALWGLAVWLFYERGGGIQQTGLIVLVYTFCVASVPVLATQPRIYLAYAALCFVPMVARIASVGDRYSLQLAGVLLLIYTITAMLARNYRDALARIIDLKLHADELAAHLRDEKQAAEAARAEAEVANRAKTQFLAAASHDLRQPLHAMGLFAEALRQRTHDAEVADLVNSINESVDALEGLFTELLDITRIDSGAIEVHPRPVALAELFRRLQLAFEPTAFEKGLTLRFRGGRHAVHTDPVLLDRIVRNLVSNAIRYTEDGTVLVGARRAGDRVRVQVWDTGAGIAPEQQERVFEEFYQVPGATAPQQRKGLGLGLAIVKRLAGLLGAPLSLRSQPGRGTVFTIELDAARAAPAEPAAAAQAKPAAVTLAGRRIVVVEDDTAVRSGLEALLASWGASLHVFDGVGAATAWAHACPDEAPKPDLLIVDYRLEAGRTGIEAIQALRARFGEVPAVVVTGSTLGLHEEEAQRHRFHLLFKPVVPNRLRAMIAFKLGMR